MSGGEASAGRQASRDPPNQSANGGYRRHSHSNLDWGSPASYDPATMATYRILLTPGDGIGPEVLEESVKVLGRIEKRFKHEFQFEEETIGGAGIDKHGVALRPETVAKAKASAAVLFGAVGGPKWDDPKATVRPEDAILGMRKQLGLFANLRPV